jgi:hypothetical protein
MTALQVREHEFTCVMGCGIGAVAVDPIQRREISAILKSKRSAAVVDHPMARGLATALGWLGMELRGFSWKDIHKAAEWLAPPGFTADEVVAMALELKNRAELT